MIKIILIIALINYIMSFITNNSSILFCGLAGFSGKKNYNAEKIKFLMYWNSIERGKDATGIFTPKSGIIKSNVKAENFINNKGIKKQIFPDKVIITHVRAKTIGTNSVDNAHPFKYGNIILAHNGTLKNHIDLAKMYNFDTKDFPVDSQILANCVNINSKYDDKIKVLEQYEGAAALLFYNEELDSLFCYHDKERPLFYGYIQGTEMYISSIKESLEAIECENIKEFDINYLYEIKNGNIVSKNKYISKEVVRSKSKIASGKDIVYKIINAKKGTFKLKCKIDDISGIVYSDCKPEYIKGFWLRCDTGNSVISNLFKKTELLIKDNWYLALGKPEEDSYKNVQGNFSEFQNSEGNRGIISTTFKFDTTNFILQSNSYGILMAKLVFAGTENVLGEKGDIVFIKDYTYGENDVNIFNLKNNKAGYCLTRHVRCAEEHEIKAYLEKSSSCELNFDNVDSPKENEETAPDVKLLQLGSENSLFEDPSRYESLYSYDTIANVLSDIYERIYNIKELLSKKRLNESLIEVNLLEDHILEFYYVEKLEEMIPKDEKKEKQKIVNKNSIIGNDNNINDWFGKNQEQEIPEETEFTVN